MNFFKISKMDGEIITSKLRAPAVLCQSKVAHADPDGQTHQLSYIDGMVSQKLISGLKNQHYMKQVLSEASTS